MTKDEWIGPPNCPVGTILDSVGSGFHGDMRIMTADGWVPLPALDSGTRLVGSTGGWFAKNENF